MPHPRLLPFPFLCFYGITGFQPTNCTCNAPVKFISFFGVRRFTADLLHCFELYMQAL